MMIIYLLLGYFILMRCGIELTFYFRATTYFFTIYPLERYRTNIESTWIRFESTDSRCIRLLGKEAYDDIMKQVDEHIKKHKDE